MSRKVLWRRVRLSAVVTAIVFAFHGFPGSVRAAAPPTGREGKAKAGERPSQKAVLAEATIVKSDVAYGEDEKQRLDVYSPKGSKGAPVVLFVHGGEWTKGDKSEVSYKPKFFNENGIVFVSVNYRLAPAAAHPAQVNDVASAICWIRDHAADCGASPEKIVLMGHSAGCHLVTLLALDRRYLARAKLPPDILRGVVAWSGGAYDLVQKVADGGTYAPYIRQAFGESALAWRDASPVTHVFDAKPIPPLLFISVERGNSSHKAAERLAGLIRSAGGRADSLLLEGRTHFTANHLLGARKTPRGNCSSISSER